MPGLKRKSAAGGTFSFRVSDVVEVPLRGILLRLRVIEGSPSMSDIGVGSTLRLKDLAGAEHEVVVKAHSVTGGKARQKRLDQTRELDIVIEPRGAEATPIEIGWMAYGPA